MQHHAVAFGCHWLSDLPLPHFAPLQPADSAPRDRVLVFQVPALADRPGLRREPLRNVLPAADGFRYLDPAGAAIDVYTPGRIDAAFPAAVAPVLPLAFFGTVTGLLLALLGRVPLHGSAVELDGEAILLCGPSGAGKSTAAAALIACGARLISDDLSALTLVHGDPHLLPGRTSLRLYPEVAGFLHAHCQWQSEPVEATGKLAVFPARVPPTQTVPLRTVLLLGEPATPPRSDASTLAEQLYRPAWMQVLPGRTQRLATLGIAAARISIRSHPPLRAESSRQLLTLGRQLLRAAHRNDPAHPASESP